MDHHRPADDVRDSEPAGEHRKKGPAAEGEKGRQISGMIGMGLAGGIEMTARVCKAGAGAVSAFVDVQGEETGAAVLGQSLDIRHDQNAAVNQIKFHRAGELRGLVAA